LVVNADTELSLPVAVQSFKTVAGERCKVVYRCCCFQSIQLQPRRALHREKGFDAFTFGKVSRPLVAAAEDHKE